MEYFEEMAQRMTPFNTMWLKSINGIFIFWSHQEDAQELLDHVNLMRHSLQSTAEKEVDNKLALLEILLTNKEQMVS